MDNVKVDLTQDDYNVLYAHHEMCQATVEALKGGEEGFRPVIVVSEHQKIMPFVGFEMSIEGVQEALELIKQDFPTPERVILTSPAQTYEIDEFGVYGPIDCLCSHIVNESGIGYVWCTAYEDGDWVPLHPGEMEDSDIYLDALASYVVDEDAEDAFDDYDEDGA